MSTLETDGRKRGVYYTAADLMVTEFPEPRWAVPGLVAEGLTILGGAPKVGKSWLCLDLGLAIAGGTPVLGKLEVEHGSVLYAALEDPPRRLKDRLGRMLGTGPAPAKLALVTQLPNMEVALDMIAEWLQTTPDARLVIIDVLAKVRPPARPGTNAYESDYQILSQLKKLADDHRVAVVVVTHLRKMEAADVFDQVSGSTGLTGSADTTLVVKRGRNEASGVVHVTGRDVVESEYAITFDPDTCTWTLDGEALAEAARNAATHRATSGLGDKAAEIVAIVAEHPEGIGPTAVGKAVEMSAQNAGTYLQRLESAGRITKTDRGRYAPVESVESVESDTDNVVAFHTFHTPPEGGA